jgi:hypothetical protein
VKGDVHTNTVENSFSLLNKDADDQELELVVAPNLKTGTVKVVTKY